MGSAAGPERVRANPCLHRLCPVASGQAIGEAPVLSRMVGGGAFPSLCPPFHLGCGPSGCGCPWGGGGGAQDPNPSAHSPLCRALVQHSRPLGAPWEPPGSEMYQGGTRVKAAGILAGLLVVWPSVRTLRVATVSHADVPTCYPSVLTGWSVSAERNSCLLLFGYPVSLFV